MNAFTNAILSILLGWLRSLFNAAWAMLSGESSTTLWQLLSLHWQAVFLVLCVGGFVADRVIYLLRWRPFYVWGSRRNQRRVQKQNNRHNAQHAPAGPDLYAPPPVYTEPESFITPTETYAERTTRYQPVVQPPASAGFAPAYRYTPPEPDTAFASAGESAPAQLPTFEYAPLPSAAPANTDDTPPSYHPYPPDSSFAPTIAYAPVAYRAAVEPESLAGEPRFDDDLSAWTSPHNSFQDFAPNVTPVAPPFTGREQDERYLRDVASGFAPPMDPEQLYAPHAAVHPGLDTETLQQNIGLTPQGTLADTRSDRATYPNFAPFSTAQPTVTAAKPRALDVLAKKARSFVDGIDEKNPPTIRDLQSTIDVTNAFRAPVYPKKPSESEE
ncbi:MAG: hypothetical protein LLF96_00345 [Eubacteriales bacterium]|nr:hypothetical protein [Eubacteriales bacterium]